MAVAMNNLVVSLEQSLRCLLLALELRREGGRGLVATSYLRKKKEKKEKRKKFLKKQQ